MAGKKYGLEDKYKMMYGGMTTPPMQASFGTLVKAGVAGAKKIAGALSKKKDIYESKGSVSGKLNKMRDVSKYDTRTLTEKGAFVKRAKKLALPDASSEFVKRRQELGLGMKVLPDTFKKPKGKRMGGLQDEKLKPGAMYKANTGRLIGNQHKLDINKDGKISGEDFKLLKSKKKR